MIERIKIKNTGPSIIEICWPAQIDNNILLDMIHCKDMLEKLYRGKLRVITFGYHILGLYFNKPQKVDYRIQEIHQRLQHMAPPVHPDRICWEIPVCYDMELAPDLKLYLKKKRLEREVFIRIHSEKKYLLHFYGFLPGFMYLGGLDEKLSCPRKSIPSPKIPKGSVAIGGTQTGIYPMDSPGGWYAIGQCPLELFNPQKNLYPPFQPGDLIQFKPVDRKTFYHLKEKANVRIKSYTACG